MSNKNKAKNKSNQSGYFSKILAPLVLILIVVGFVYWGSDESNKTSENPVAKGVAKFYAEVRQALKPGAERLNDYTIKLPKPKVAMGDQLASRDGNVKPAPSDWNGANKKRSFKQNETLKNVLTRYAQEEGVELIWDLEYDYIVKHHFAESSNLKALVSKISSVVNNDYEGTVNTYFCQDASALVITNKSNEYISKYCKSTKI